MMNIFNVSFPASWLDVFDVNDLNSTILRYMKTNN